MIKYRSFGQFASLGLNMIPEEYLFIFNFNQSNFLFEI